MINQYLIDHSTNASIDGRQALGAEIEGEASGCGVVQAPFATWRCAARGQGSKVGPGQGTKDVNQ